MFCDFRVLIATKFEEPCCARRCDFTLQPLHIDMNLQAAITLQPLRIDMNMQAAINEGLQINGQLERQHFVEAQRRSTRRSSRVLGWFVNIGTLELLAPLVATSSLSPHDAASLDRSLTPNPKGPINNSYMDY